jgi:hypothetical protein
MYKFPAEYALIVFGSTKLSGKIVPELLDLAERGIVRYLDIVFIQKDPDGSTRKVELNDLDEESYRLFVPLGEAVESLFTEDDLNQAANMLPKNSSAALLLWENLWAENIRKAIIDSGGKLVDRGQIPAEAVEQVRQESTVEE